MAYCGKCGTQLEDDAKFCPNCGAPVDGIDSVESIDSVDDKKAKNEVIIVISAFAIFIILGLIFLSNSGKKDKIKEQAKIEESVRQDNLKSSNSSENQNVESREYNEKSYYNEDYKQKTIEYENQLVGIANEIERQCNQFSALSSGDVDPLTYGRMQIALTNNIYDLEKKAEKIFDELVKLANQSGNENAVSVIKESKRKFMSDAERMKHEVRDGGNGY